MIGGVPQGPWGPPYPVYRGCVLPPYGCEDPVNNLPDCLYRTTEEILKCTNASIDLILPCVLSTMSLSTQGLIDVVNPFGAQCPVSLNLLTVAPSGEGKTAISTLALKPIVDMEEQRHRDYESRRKDYDSDQFLHDEKTRELKTKVRKKIKAGQSTEDVKKEIDALVRSAPIAPRRPKILQETATPEALISGLSENIPYAGVISSEGSNILHSRAFNKQGFQNSIWSGDSVHVATKEGGNKILKDARLTTHVMSQPGVIKQFFEKKGADMRASGMLARFLVFFPESTQGFRQRWEAQPCGSAYQTFYDQVYSFIQVMLDQFDKGITEKVSVRFSDDAAEYWKRIANEVETNLAPGGRFECAPDHGSRIAENIARVAAILSYFEERSEEISIDMLKSALHIVLASSRQFMQNLVPEPQYVIDGRILYEWLQRKVWSQGYRFVRKRYIIQYGPNQLRGDPWRLDNALTDLARAGSIMWNNSVQPAYVDMFPGVVEPGRFELEVFLSPLGRKNSTALTSL